MSPGTPKGNPPSGGKQTDDDSLSDGLNATLMLGKQRLVAPPSPSPFEEDEGSLMAGDSLLEDAESMVAGPSPVDDSGDAPVELADFSVQGDGDERTMIELGDAPLSPAEDRLQLAVNAPAPAPNFTDTLGALVSGDDDDSVVSSVPQRLFMPKPVVGPPDEPTMLELEDEEVEEVEPSRLVPIPDFAHDDERPRPAEQRRTLFGPPGAAPGSEAGIPSPDPVGGGPVSVARPTGTEGASARLPAAPAAPAAPARAAAPVRPAQPVAPPKAAGATNTGMPIAPPPAERAPARQAPAPSPARPAPAASAPRPAAAPSSARPAAVPSAAVPSAAAQAAAARRTQLPQRAAMPPEPAAAPEAPPKTGGRGKWIVLSVVLVMVAGGASAVVILDPFGLMKPKEVVAAAGPPVVEMASEPGAVEVYDNGQFVGETPIRHEPPATQGGHDLKFVGLKGIYTVKTPRIEGTSSLFARLPAERGVKIGHVVLKAESGATVSVDDRAIGKTPLVFVGAVGQAVAFSLSLEGRQAKVTGTPTAEGGTVEAKLE